MINSKQGSEGFFQEGARQENILGRTWGVNRNAEANDQEPTPGPPGEEEIAEGKRTLEIPAAVVTGVAEVVKGAVNAGFEKLSEGQGADSAVTSLPMSVGHGDILAASKKYGGGQW